MRMPAPSPVFDLAAARAAVLQVDAGPAAPCATIVVRSAALDVDDEADAAGVVFVARIVETGRTGGRDMERQLLQGLS